jgi:hypothetical protein
MLNAPLVSVVAPFVELLINTLAGDKALPDWFLTTPVIFHCLSCALPVLKKIIKITTSNPIGFLIDFSFQHL